MAAADPCQWSMGTPRNPFVNDVLALNERQNPERIAGTVRYLAGTDDGEGVQIEWRECCVQSDADQSLWWFENDITTTGTAYRYYLHDVRSPGYQPWVSMLQGVDQDYGVQGGRHFPEGHKVSFVPMRPSDLLRESGVGSPICVTKVRASGEATFETLTLPNWAQGVAINIVQDLPAHQPHRTNPRGPVLEFRQPTAVRLRGAISAY